MAAVEWGLINLTYATDARITVHLFNKPIILYDGSLKKFRSEQKYFEITIEGVCKGTTLIRDILNCIDEEHNLYIRDEKYADAVITNFDYDYWRTSEGQKWYRYRLTFISPNKEE